MNFHSLMLWKENKSILIKIIMEKVSTDAETYKKLYFSFSFQQFLKKLQKIKGNRKYKMFFYVK